MTRCPMTHQLACSALAVLTESAMLRHAGVFVGVTLGAVLLSHIPNPYALPAGGRHQ